MWHSWTFLDDGWWWHGDTLRHRPDGRFTHLAFTHCMLSTPGYGSVPGSKLVSTSNNSIVVCGSGKWNLVKSETDFPTNLISLFSDGLCSVSLVSGKLSITFSRKWKLGIRIVAQIYLKSIFGLDWTNHRHKVNLSWQPLTMTKQRN